MGPLVPVRERLLMSLIDRLKRLVFRGDESFFGYPNSFGRRGQVDDPSYPPVSDNAGPIGSNVGPGGTSAYWDPNFVPYPAADWPIDLEVACKKCLKPCRVIYIDGGLVLMDDNRTRHNCQNPLRNG